MLDEQPEYKNVVCFKLIDLCDPSITYQSFVVFSDLIIAGSFHVSPHYPEGNVELSQAYLY